MSSAAEIASRSSVDGGPTRRRIARIDGRCKAALRVKAKVAGYASRLGGFPDAVTLAAYQKAAELAVVAEDLRAKQLRGEPVDLSEMAKAQGLADRAERALGLDRKRGPAPGSLGELLRQDRVDRLAAAADADDAA